MLTPSILQQFPDQIGCKREECVCVSSNGQSTLLPRHLASRHAFLTTSFKWLENAGKALFLNNSRPGSHQRRGDRDMRGSEDRSDRLPLSYGFLRETARSIMRAANSR